MRATFSQIGGVRVGGGTFFSFNASWPFASILVADSVLTISCLGMSWVFPKGSIRRLSPCSGLFSDGLRIEHNVVGNAEFIVFWTFKLAHLQRELEQRGYSVDEPEF
ncbi:hypothetical protein [Cyanobium sp. ATX 6F1]|uniref:hypothetical protein n=1 Tax=unclassified Cyanobium TaxID=2627006 RepID=UPI0020CE1C63|nr:hypothetical protein [Cyanobium sp. ATX 6F1]MCP9915869.1 hypothetical protein [Cyanobium sp. ATX 6F1]